MTSYISIGDDNDYIQNDENGWQDYHNGVNIALHPTDDRDDDNNDQ